MKYLVLVVVAALAACSNSPAVSLDGGVRDGATDASPGMVDPGHSSVTTDRDMTGVDDPAVNVTVTLRDSHDTPIAGVSVQLVVGSGSTTPPPPTGADGSTTAAWTNTVAGTFDVALVVDGATVGTHTVQFMPGAATALAYVQQPTDVLSGNLISPAVSVVTVDDFGNPVSVASGTVQLALEGGPSAEVLEGDTSNSISAGTATFPSLLVRTPGAGYTIRAQMAGLTDAVSAPFNVIGHSSMDLAPTSLQADGNQTATITVHAIDASGAAIVGANVSLSVSGSNNVVTAASSTTDANGIFTASVRSTTAEVKTVTVMVSAATLMGTLHFFGPPCKLQLPSPAGVRLNYSATAMLVDDLDGDGDADAVILEGHDLVVYRGRGDATFDPPVTLGVPGQSPTRIKAADVNGDGHRDLLITSPGNSFITFYLGLGAAQFAAPTSSGTLAPAAIAEFTSGDFNGDGHLDLVVVSAHTLVVSLSDGNGNFTTSQTLSVDTHEVGAVDLNLDGRLDLVVTNPTGVRSLLGNGDGTFAAPVVTAGAGAGSLVIADFNNDGKPDCAVGNPDWTLQPFLGTGTGAFTKVGTAIPTAEYNSGATGTALIRGARDLDGDGNVDLVLGEKPFLTILKGGGDGTFAMAHVYATPTNGGMGVGDADGDGTPDVIVAYSWLLAPLHGRADGSLVAPERHAEPTGQAGLSGSSVDFDGDGNDDLLYQSAQGITALLSRGDGTLTDAAVLAQSQTATDLRVADVTGDGIVDVVGLFPASTGVTVGVAAGVGDGTFAPFTSVAEQLNGSRLGFLDLDRDGKEDLVMSSSDGVWLARSIGDGTFDPPQQIPGASGWTVTADIDGDGITDVLSTASTGIISIFLGDGVGGVVQAPYSVNLNEMQPPGPLVGDVTGDGRADIVVTDGNEFAGYEVHVFPGLASGGFGSPLVTWTDKLFFPSVLADMTGDGALDLIGIDSYSAISVVPGYGDGYFVVPAIRYPAIDGQGIVVGEFNGDGRPDIAFGTGPGAAVALNGGCVP